MDPGGSVGKSVDESVSVVDSNTVGVPFRGGVGSEQEEISKLVSIINLISL
jgi:hypothetical protein